MRGGLERWKRGVGSQGVRQAIAYAFEGSCDSHLHTHSGADALARYSDAEDAAVERFVVQDGTVSRDSLDSTGLTRWVNGDDPETGERRGRELSSPDADLVLDGTINAPKSFSVAALLVPELAAEFEGLQDRLRDRIITTWQRELNARRGAGGRIREQITRVEVVELQHRRSRALDPHIHRHLWLNVKVLGADGRWSNVDSRVAMKLHTVINAEGEIAARTDPQWVAALARHGYTLDADGEVAQLTHLVRPLSRRSNQIEANRAKKLAQWQAAHPGQEPDHVVLTAIDRWAWAQGRPNKPGQLEEDAWEQMVEGEILAVDAHATTARGPVPVAAVSVADVDRDLLAAMAIAEADRRSAGCGGRFSAFDVRAGAMRAIAASGVVAERAVLDEVIEDVVARGLEHTIDMLDQEPDIPAHIKHMMSLETAALKLDLAAQFDALNEQGVTVDADTITDVAGTVLTGTTTTSLDAGQTGAAGAIAGTDRLVTVTGPAGTGKTTMLRVAKRALENQGRRLVVVAPTKKAASVAGRETGAVASSLHALLVDHGWRFADDAAGRQQWTQLQVGDSDPLTGGIYQGPRRHILRAGDRIVVDEAGMVDLHTAHALAVVAGQTRAGIAMVGDHLQAMPVGHSGAMATMKRRSGAVVELTAVHRFKNPAYAALSLRLREPDDAAAARALAGELVQLGHVHRVGTDTAVREYMVGQYFHHTRRGARVALVTGTNVEAQQINEAIQQQRLDAGEVNMAEVAVGQNEQRLLVGDVVQTRRNDRASDVENRALWSVKAISAEKITLAALDDSGDLREVTPDYTAEHVHLAYASTVHGIQGETVDASIVGPGVDASGLYVGMTRGRVHNQVVTIARTDDAAADQVAGMMMRGTPEVTLDDSARAARTELGRAARTPAATEDLTLARWDDSTRRPLGRIIDLDRYVTQATEQTPTVRARLEALGDKIVRGRKALSDTEVKIAGVNARNHAFRATGASESDTTSLVTVRERLIVSLGTLREERSTLGKQYTALTGILEQADTERAIRAHQPASVAHHEHVARLTYANGTTSPTRTTRGPSL